MVLYNGERDFVEIGCEVKYDNMWRGWCSKAISGS
jgi:hypothetical protein